MLKKNTLAILIAAAFAAPTFAHHPNDEHEIPLHQWPVKIGTHN